MATDQHFIPAFSLETVFLDKDTGAPLSGGIVTFERSLQPGTLKPVYQITGADPNFTYIQLPNPMILSSIGTFEDSLGNPVIPYFLPYGSDLVTVDYYRVIVQSSGLVPQFVRDPVPFIPMSGQNGVSSAFENEISNPQFAEVLFDTTVSTYTYNFNTETKTVNIAPNWDLVVTSPGIGTVTVNQITPVGDINIITNPGTILEINSAGLSALRLRQRIFGSPNLWGSGNLAASFVAKTFGGTSTTITMVYSQSDGTVIDKLIVAGILNGNGNYDAFPGTGNIPISDSLQFFPNSYIDIDLVLPVGVNIAITSVMIAPTGLAVVSDIVYDQESQYRQIDHLFHYYQSQINFKPISSLLTGWDFPLNPAQLGQTGNLSGAGAYIWDQTIAARGATNIAYTRNSITGGLQFTTAGAVPDAFLICQYLSGAEASKILGSKLSVNLNAYRGSAGGAITFQISLYRGSSAAVFPTLGNLIGNLDINGNFTKNNTAGQGLNWTEIPRGNLNIVGKGTLSTVVTNDQIDSTNNDYGFNGWEVTDPTEISDTNKFCIIVTFAYVAISTVVVVNSVSLIPGDIPTRPAPQTPDEVLRECQYYYENSYDSGIAPGTASTTTYPIFPSQTVVSGGNTLVGESPFTIRFSTAKRVTNPTVTLYNPVAGTINNVRVVLIYAGVSQTPVDTSSANWTQLTLGSKFSSYDAANNTKFYTFATVGDYSSAYIAAHYTIEARLGIV